MSNLPRQLDVNEILVGKDILELISSAMYIDPLTIFREYIQNSADSIELAKINGIIVGNQLGRIDISLDLDARKIKIRDNGEGVKNELFVRRLTSLGGSSKRGTEARGFRGVGRLAALGYCQELIFRSRSKADKKVLELRWDCKVFKKLLLDHAYNNSVSELIKEVVSIRELDADEWPTHFFEVEMIKPIRIKNDLLLNDAAIYSYLSQVACVPFSPSFKFRDNINKFLLTYLRQAEVDIFINGSEKPIYRPYRDTYYYGDDKSDNFIEPEFFVIDGISGGIAAIVWLLHHGYNGSIPVSAGIGGLRARKGNIQVGDMRIFSEIFPEPRFASWTVGEVHICDPRILPNGRRDDFELNAHYNHILAHLNAIGDSIARKCRRSSVVRNRIKIIQNGVSKVDEMLRIAEQGTLEIAPTKRLVKDIRSELYEIKNTITPSILDEPEVMKLKNKCTAIERRLDKFERSGGAAKELMNVPKGQRIIIQKMIGLIYECSQNKVAAKALVDRILARLGSS